MGSRSAFFVCSDNRARTCVQPDEAGSSTTELMDALRIFQQNIRYFIKPVTNCAEVNSFLELLQAVIYSIFGNLDRFDPIEANFVRLVKSHN